MVWLEKFVYIPKNNTVNDTSSSLTSKCYVILVMLPTVAILSLCVITLFTCLFIVNIGLFYTCPFNKYINYCLLFINICILIDLYFALFYDYYDKIGNVSIILFILYKILNSVMTLLILNVICKTTSKLSTYQSIYINLKLQITFIQTITNKMDNCPYLGWFVNT